MNQHCSCTNIPTRLSEKAVWSHGVEARIIEPTLMHYYQLKKEGGFIMTQATKPRADSSAISLAAITAGAVAAALVIMSIGSIVTIISIGTSINPGMQANARLMDVNAPVDHVAVLSTKFHDNGNRHFQQVNKLTKRNEKSFYIDAVLREDTHHMPTPTTDKTIQQPKLTVKGNHVFA
ncbi:MAG: hypothetical protein ACAH05_05465 [Methylophilus sp.]|nr:hypothetical protein [Methylophilus sp.]